MSSISEYQRNPYSKYGYVKERSWSDDEDSDPDRVPRVHRKAKHPSKTFGPVDQAKSSTAPPTSEILRRNRTPKTKKDTGEVKIQADDWKADGRKKAVTAGMSEAEKAYRRALAADYSKLWRTMKGVRQSEWYESANQVERQGMEERVKWIVRNERIKNGEHTTVKMRRWYMAKGEVVPEGLRTLVERKDLLSSWKLSGADVREGPEWQPQRSKQEAPKLVKSVTGRKLKCDVREEETDCSNELTEKMADLEGQAKEEPSEESEDDSDEGSDEAQEEVLALHKMLTPRTTVSLTPRISTSRSVIQEERPEKRIKSCTGIVRRFGHCLNPLDELEDDIDQ